MVAIPDWEGCTTLNYSTDDLAEFLGYCFDDGNTYIFKNFDLENVEDYKNYENYQWNIVFTIIKRFTQQYPNNKLEFINDEENINKLSNFNIYCYFVN